MLRNSLSVGMLALALVFGSHQAQAQSSRQLDSASAESKVFLLTATYGVVAGTLTGLGSLAFYKHPSEHSRNVAIGASIGLYVGILLGAYMTYGVSDGKSSSSGSGGSKPSGGKGPVLEDPLRLGMSESVAPRLVPRWSPFFAFDEKQKNVLLGVNYIY